MSVLVDTIPATPMGISVLSPTPAGPGGAAINTNFITIATLIKAAQTAITNLQSAMAALGTASTQPTSAFDAAGVAAVVAANLVTTNTQVNTNTTSIATLNSASAKLPIAGGTLTGNLTGTTAKFDSVKNTVTAYSGSGSSIAMSICTGIMTITTPSACAFTTTSPGGVPANTIFTLKNISSTNVTFSASSSSLDGVGAGTKIIASQASFRFYTDGTNWFSV